MPLVFCCREGCSAHHPIRRLPREYRFSSRPLDPSAAAGLLPLLATDPGLTTLESTLNPNPLNPNRFDGARATALQNVPKRPAVLANVTRRHLSTASEAAYRHRESPIKRCDGNVSDVFSFRCSARHREWGSRQLRRYAHAESADHQTDAAGSRGRGKGGSEFIIYQCLGLFG